VLETEQHGIFEHSATQPCAKRCSWVQLQVRGLTATSYGVSRELSCVADTEGICVN